MYFLGLDLGQKRDHTAIVIVERPEPDIYGSRCKQLLVRHAERVPLGTAYPQVVERVRALVGSPLLAGRCAVVVDATGVGAPVMDLLRQAGLGCEIAAVTITSGERETRQGGRGGRVYGVPKETLVALVVVLLEQSELRVSARMRERAALVRELLDTQARPRGTLAPKIGAEGTDEHDDLLMALALACWRARRREIGFGEGRLPGI